MPKGPVRREPCIVWAAHHGMEDLLSDREVPALQLLASVFLICWLIEMDSDTSFNNLTSHTQGLDWL